MKKYMSYREAAEFTGISGGTLYALVSRNQIPHFRIGPRLVRFHMDDLKRFLAERKQSGTGFTTEKALNEKSKNK